VTGPPLGLLRGVSAPYPRGDTQAQKQQQQRRWQAGRVSPVAWQGSVAVNEGEVDRLIASSAALTGQRSSAGRPFLNVVPPIDQENAETLPLLESRHPGVRCWSSLLLHPPLPQSSRSGDTEMPKRSASKASIKCSTSKKCNGSNPLIQRAVLDPRRASLQSCVCALFCSGNQQQRRRTGRPAASTDAGCSDAVAAGCEARADRATAGISEHPCTACGCSTERRHTRSLSHSPCFPGEYYLCSV
jgi:hypothetical protein